MVSESGFTGLSSKKISVLSILALFILGFSSMGASAPTEVTGCQDITSSGVYNLTQDFEVGGSVQDSCINITSSDVVFDGLGHSINAVETDSFDIFSVKNSSSRISNITVKDVSAFNTTDNGYSFDAEEVDNSDFKNLSFSDTGFGFFISDSTNVSISDMNLTDIPKLPISGFFGTDNVNFTNIDVDNEDIVIDPGSYTLRSEGPDIEIKNSDFTDSLGDFNIEDSGTTISNTKISSSSNVFVKSGETLTLNNFTSDGTVITGEIHSADFTEGAAFLENDELRNLDNVKAINLHNKSADAYANINISYDESANKGIDEQGLAFYRLNTTLNPSEFTKLNPSYGGVNIQQNYVYANITAEDMDTGDTDVRGFAVLDNKFDVEGCQKIDYSGEFELTGDLENIEDQSKCLDIESSDVHVHGLGNRLINSSDGQTVAFEIGNSPSIYSNITVENLTIDKWHEGIILEDGVQNTSITDSVLDTERTALYPKYGTKNITFKQSTVKNTIGGSTGGINVRGQHHLISNNTFDNLYGAVDIRGASNLSFINNTLNGGLGTDINVDGSNITIENNDILTGNRPISVDNGDKIKIASNELQAGYYGIEVLRTVSNLTISGNDIEGPDQTGFGSGISIVKDNGNAPENITVQDNNITNSVSNGTYIENALEVTLKDNRIEGSGKHGVSSTGTNLTMEDNYIAQSGFWGVYLANTTDSVIESNVMDGVSVYNISENSIIRNSVNISDKYVEFRSNNSEESISLNLSDSFNLSISGQRVNLSANQSNIPSIPEGNLSIAEFEAQNKSGGDEWMQLNVSYTDESVRGIDESSLGIYHNNGSWGEVSELNVASNKNLVRGNITEFSPVSVYGERDPLSSTPSSHDYGSVDTGSSVEKEFVIENLGRKNLTLTSSSVSGSESNQFDIVSGNIGSNKNLTPYENTSITVQFNPDSDGEKDATLEIDSDDPQGALNIDLNGEGTSSDDGTGGGGGGGGAPPADTNDNPKKTQTFFDPVAGKPSEVDVDDEDIGVDRVTVYPASNLSSLEVTVEGLSGQPDDVSNPSGEVVDRYMDIFTDASEEDIGNATVEFTVEDQWIEDNDVDPSTIRLERYHDDSWDQLETEEVGQTDSGIEFEAVTDGFSYFAVAADQESTDDSGDQDSGDDSQMNETDDSTGTNESTNETQSDEKEDQAGSLMDGLLLPAIALLFVLIAGAVAYLKREELSELISNDGSSEEEEISFN